MLRKESPQQCCGSGIPDPNFFSSRIRIKEFKYFSTQKIVSKLSEICSGLIIPRPSRIPDPGVKKAPDPGSGSQHCSSGSWAEIKAQNLNCCWRARKRPSYGTHLKNEQHTDLYSILHFIQYHAYDEIQHSGHGLEVF